MKLKDIQANIQNVLSDRYWDYNAYAIRSIVDDWAGAKCDLKSMLEKHPAWDGEKLAVVLETTIHRIPDFSKAYKLSRHFCDCRAAKQFISDAFKSPTIKGDEQIYMLGAYRKLDYLNEQVKLNLRAGMKTTSAVMKIAKRLGIDKNPDFLRDFSAYADEITPLAIPVWLVISVNPVDYLLMSHANSWTSCHNIEDADEPGCYSAGTISYMLDNTSIIVYALRKKDYSILPEDIATLPKYCRQVFSYDCNTGNLAQLRLYPQLCDTGADVQYTEIREAVQGAINDSLCMSGEWAGFESDAYLFIQAGRDAQNYPDYEPGCPGSTHCNISNANKVSPRRITIGHQPRCISCGDLHYNHESILCENCAGTAYYCEGCGARVDEEDAYCINGEIYCHDCVVFCEVCGEAILPEDGYETRNGYVCGYCHDHDYCYPVDEDDYYYPIEDCVYCEETGEWYLGSNEGNTWHYCCECGAVVPDGDEYHCYKGTYCEDCFNHLPEEVIKAYNDGKPEPEEGRD